MRYYEVVMLTAHTTAKTAYTYASKEKLPIGGRVVVPFGRHNREAVALVLQEVCKPKFRSKMVKQVIDGSAVLPDAMLTLFRKMVKEYFLPWGQSLNYFLPPAAHDVYHVTEEGQLVLHQKQTVNPVYRLTASLDEIPHHYRAQRRVAALLMNGPLDVKTMHEMCYTPPSVYQSMIKNGYIETVTIEERVCDPPALNPSQYTVMEGIIHSSLPWHMLYGVTSSGKTEVYIGLLRAVLAQNKQVLIMVPEIGLIPQMIQRIRPHVEGEIAVIHHRTAKGERLEDWKGLFNGDIRVAVGVRSGLLAPMKDLGLVIIDEMHDGAYEPLESQGYDICEMALLRSNLQEAKVVLGSATPKVSWMYRATKDSHMKIWTLKERFGKYPLPPVEVVDMREELKEGNRSIISRKLHDCMENTLEKKRQSMLLMNRRGFSTFVSCRSCGHVMRCPHDGQTLTYHRHEKSLVCHLCGYKTMAPTVCPVCGSSTIRYFGIGTEQVVSAVKEQFPQAVTMRMDHDTTRQKGSHEEIVQKMREGQADILIGTQMIAKGHDFPLVDTVGILAADLSLLIPQYDAAEKTFQLITQMAGRSGRHSDQGQVILQTYLPEHYAIQKGASHDYPHFYSEELRMRQMTGFPPFHEIMEVRVLPGLDAPKGYEKIHEINAVFLTMVETETLNAKLWRAFSPVPYEHFSAKHPTIYTWLVTYDKQVASVFDVIWDRLAQEIMDDGLIIQWNRKRW